MTEAFTEDALLGGRVRLRQPRDGFRAAIDSVLLAAATPAAPGDAVFEPGAGAGAAALCLARRVEGCRVVGIELQPDLVRLAGDNARLNGLGDRIDVVVGDIARPPPRIEPGGFAHVMMNPPHHVADRVDVSPDAARARANAEGAAPLALWLDAGLRMLVRRGTLTLIHRADRLDEILALLHGRAGEIVVFPLWPGAGGKPAKRVVVRARKDAATPLRLAPGLVLHGEGGGFTARADAVLRGAALDI
jgi:tRNA1(Val) A37 N6-methylase TrmN6